MRSRHDPSLTLSAQVARARREVAHALTLARRDMRRMLESRLGRRLNAAEEAELSAGLARVAAQRQAETDGIVQDLATGRIDVARLTREMLALRGERRNPPRTPRHVRGVATRRAPGSPTSSTRQASETRAPEAAAPDGPEAGPSAPSGIRALRLWAPTRREAERIARAALARFPFARTFVVPADLAACARCGSALDQRCGHTCGLGFCSACVLALEEEGGRS